MGLIPGLEDYLKKEWQPTPIFLLEKCHGWRSLTGYSPWGCKESNATEPLTLKHSEHIYRDIWGNLGEQRVIKVAFQSSMEELMSPPTLIGCITGKYIFSLSIRFSHVKYEDKSCLLCVVKNINPINFKETYTKHSITIYLKGK